LIPIQDRHSPAPQSIPLLPGKMIPCLLCLLISFVAAVAVVFIVFPVAHVIVALVVACLLAYALVFAFNSVRRAEVRPAAQAALELYEKQHGKTPNLPDKLRGVFWFGTNKAPELLWTLEGTEFDEANRRITLKSGGEFNWTYSTGVIGWLYWAGLRFSYMLCAKLHIDFEDDDLAFAKLPLFMCNCIWTPMGMWWHLKQIDENTWDRPIYLYCMPWRKWEFGSYVFQRIIDENGNKLPAFDDMVRSTEEGLEGYPHKPSMQIMNGDSGNFDFCSGNSDAYRKL